MQLARAGEHGPRVFKVSTLRLAATGVAVLLSTNTTFAAADTAPANLSEVVITATRTRQPLTQLAVPVIVITRDTIDNALAGDAADLIAALPGVEVARTGGPGQPATIFMRGTDSNHTAVLIDGVRINPGTIGGAAIQNILPESIERIEIVKGARSTLYGTDAIGGVINIITRAGAARGASAFASAGRYGTNAFAADDGISPAAGLNLGAGIAWQNSDGFAPQVGEDTRRGYHNRSGTLSAGWQASDALSFSARAWRASGRSEYTGYDSNFNLAPVAQDFTTAAYALTAAWTAPAALSARATLSRVVDDIDQQENSDYAHTRRDSLDLQFDLPLGSRQLLTAGTLLAREHAAAVSFGTEFRVRTDTTLVYLQDQVQLGGGELLLAAGRTHHQTFGSRGTWNVEYGHALGAALRVTLAAGTAFHAPDGSDRFGFGGNPDLRPEFAREFAAGIAWRMGAGQTLKLDAFENRIDDLVEYVLVDPENFIYQTQNVGRTRIRGLEAGYEFDGAGWRLSASATLQDPKNLQTDAELLRRARHYFALQLERGVGPVSLSAMLHASGARMDAGFSSDVSVPGYALLNLGARWRITPAWSAQLKVDNALDRHYQIINGYHTARRSFNVATRYQFR
jgi:vitamin B12 transporter